MFNYSKGWFYQTLNNKYSKMFTYIYKCLPILNYDSIKHIIINIENVYK